MRLKLKVKKNIVWFNILLIWFLDFLVFVLEQPNTESTDTSIDKNDEITGINQTENIQGFTKKLPEDIEGRHLPSQSQNETDVWNFVKSFVSMSIRIFHKAPYQCITRVNLQKYGYIKVMI